MTELQKPGRDPRPEFKSADFLEGVEQIGDLKPGMLLEGTVTNVTNFGAFVDVGVHQDGLVHISALSKTFVKDPHTVVKTGDVVKVKVLEVDAQRKRIALTMRLDDEIPVTGESGLKVAASSKERKEVAKSNYKTSSTSVVSASAGSFGNLLKDALKRK